MAEMQLSSSLSVAGQLNAEDITRLAKQGFKTFICNRPDGEGGPEQPDSRVLAQDAQAQGASFYYLPMAAGIAPPPDVVAEFARLYEQADKPILAFCRSGTRSSNIFQAITRL
ncbi:MAG: TIGR01244 family phosphatase [Limnobacter sp.]|nr:TIGR01244 family phosphatase [Limnobacter sp.]